MNDKLIIKDYLCNIIEIYPYLSPSFTHKTEHDRNAGIKNKSQVVRWRQVQPRFKKSFKNVR